MNRIDADLLHALGELDEALAVLDGDTLVALNAPMQALAPGEPAQAAADWAASVLGLATALEAPLGARQRCGVSGEYLAQRVALDARHVLLRLTDERARLHHLQRQLDDREGLLFTSRSLTVSEMGSVLAHELNQPIGATANLLRGLKLRLSRRHPDSTDELAALDKAVQQVTYASQIIGRVREYTQSRQPKTSRPSASMTLVIRSRHLVWVSGGRNTMPTPYSPAAGRSIPRAAASRWNSLSGV